MVEIVFLELPNELKLKTLSHLSAPEIQRARRTCKHFRDLIDEPTNESILVRPGKDRSVARIGETVEYHSNFESVDLLEALARFLTRRGLCKYAPLQFLTLFPFVRAWVQRTLPKTMGHVKDSDDPHPEEKKIMLAIFTLINVHKQHHAPQLFDEGVKIYAFQDLLHEFARIGVSDRLEMFGLSEHRLQAWYNDLVATPGGRFKEAPIGPCVRLELPDWLLSHVRYVRPFTSETEPYGPWGNAVANTMRVAKTFGIAEPRNKSPDLFTYYVKTPWAHEMARKAVSGEMLKPLMKAAVLEEIMIF